MGAARLYFARLSNQFVMFLYVCDVQSLKGVFQAKAITAAIITISANSRFMSEIARNAGRDQWNSLNRSAYVRQSRDYGATGKWSKLRKRSPRRPTQPRLFLRGVESSRASGDVFACDRKGPELILRRVRMSSCIAFIFRCRTDRGRDSLMINFPTSDI